MIESIGVEKHSEHKSRCSDLLYNCKQAEESWCIIDKIDATIGGTRLADYITGVIENPSHHNLYEQLCVLRFFRLLGKYEMRLSKVHHFIRFFELLPLPGAGGLTKYKMSPVQVFQFVNIMGFYRDETHRLITDVVLFVPRKYGKTTVCAVLAFYDTMFGDYDAQAYLSANSLEQAKIGFSVATKIARHLDKDKTRFKVGTTKVEVYANNRDSFIKCLTNSPSKLDGLKASISVSDEISQADSFDLKNVITTSMGTRENPLTVEITTASDKPDTPFTEELDYFMKMLRAELGDDINVEDDSNFASIFCPDLGDEEHDPVTWCKCNPHIGYTVSLDYYKNWYKKSLRSYDNAKAFRTKLLNIFVSGDVQTWIPSDKMRHLMRPIDITTLPDVYPAAVAIDLSVSDDLSAVCNLWYVEDEKKFYAKFDFYFPSGQLERHTNSAIYKRWAEMGYLHLIEGDTIDYPIIANDIISANDYLMQFSIGYDPYKAAELLNILRAAGAGDVLKSVSQVRSQFTAPCGQLEILIAREQIVFDDNPIISWCFDNAVLDKDCNGNCKPVKLYKSSAQKIDGLIALLMCVKLFAEGGYFDDN